MSGNEEYMTPVTSRNFDRLVDGEMSESERRALLSQLDDEPQGWRQCALAFLESQCFREALAPLGHSAGRAEIAAAEPQAKVEARNSRRSGRLWIATKVLALAACFFFAMVFGWWIRPLLHGNQAALSQLAQEDSSAKRDLFPAANMRGAEPNSGSPWQMVTVSVPSGKPGQSEAIQVPAIERSAIDNAWLNNVPNLPPDVLAALRSRGHQVQQSRELVTVPLEDGRHLVVPMDQVEVRYVGNEYQ